MKSKAQKTTYTYYIWDEDSKKEIPVTITAGENGVNQEHIIWLEKFDHDEHLQERYTEENRDYSTENKKAELSLGDEDNEYDPIDLLATNDTNPDMLFDEEDVPDSQVEKLLTLIETLTPQQIDLIYAHYGERKYLADIAREEGCTTPAITNRKNKIINRLRKMFSNFDVR